MTAHETDELAELVSAAARGASEAERELFDRYERFVRRRLTEARRRRNWFWLTDLDEAVQDVFILFFKAIGDGKFRYQDPEGLEGFLVRSLFFAVMNIKDRTSQERPISSYDHEDGGNGVLDLVSFSEEAWVSKDRQDCLKQLYEALSELNESRRDILLRTLSGEKVRDICQATRRSPASVSGLKHNALKDLRSILLARGFLGECGAILGLAGEGVEL